MKRRKSRTHALDIPAGMHRNLSESHLVQAGSKAVSNVAEQFSKIGQSLNPKVLTGKKSNVIDSISIDSPKEIPIEHCNNQMEHGENEMGMGGGGDSATADSVNKCNNDSFLQSVGIVMVDAAEMAETQNQTKPRKASNSKNLENVAHISISSVTDNVKLPPEMLELSNLPNKSITPEISVQDSEVVRGDGPDDRGNNLKMAHSVSDMRSSHLAFEDDANGDDAAR